MPRIAKLFLNGRSQAVRLPADFRFEGTEVFISQEPETGNVILSRRPYSSWRGFIRLRNSSRVPADFLADRGDRAPQDRNLF
jgi:antitoxin VapB